MVFIVSSGNLTFNLRVFFLYSSSAWMDRG
jgi:hypothetical protein